MYAVVGCGECEALWVVEGRPETSECPRCGHRREHAMRTKFHTAEDADEAREARARLLAERRGEADAFASVDAFADLDSVVDEAGVDDETYLSASGVDPDAVAEAGERAARPGGSGRSRRQAVREAIRDLQAPDEAAVVARATERGVPADYVRRALDRLREEGDVAVEDGIYRLL